MFTIKHLRAWRAQGRGSPLMFFFIVFYVGIIYLFVRHNFQETGIEQENEEFDLQKLAKDEGQSTSEQEIVFFLILCEGEAKAGQGGKKANDISRQLRQAAVMLKSAVALSSSRLRFLVVADSKNLYQKFSNLPTAWPEEYQRRISIEYHDVWFPADRADMRNMFRVCATERLFLPDMFPDLDAAIYIDTDLIFLRPPEHLWDEFSKFGSKQVAAMAPCLYHYSTKRNKVPYYGTSGLNAGIMHMNLTRMKQFPGGGWTPANMAVFDHYKKIIKLADQDILNILFNKNPDLLYELGCQWNYRIWQCSQGTNMCPKAASNGASILHGNALAFVSGAEMKLQVMFEAWENYTLGSSLEDLLIRIKKNLQEVSKLRKPSKCAQIPDIDAILTKSLEEFISTSS